MARNFRAVEAERERDELRRRIAEAVELLRLGDLNDSEALAIANNLNRLLDAEEVK